MKSPFSLMVLMMLFTAPAEADAPPAGGVLDSTEGVRVGVEAASSPLVPTAGRGPSVAEKTKIEKAVKSLSIPFVANNGQTDPTVAYYAQTFAGRKCHYGSSFSLGGPVNRFPRLGFDGNIRGWASKIKRKGPFAD